MLDQMISYRVPKQTATHGDVLAAVGLASLLAEASDGKPVRIVDTGFHFTIELSSPLREDELARLGAAPGYPFLKTADNVAVPAGVSDVVDYRQEKTKVSRQRQAREAAKKLPKQASGQELAELVQQEAVRGDWRLLRALNDLQGDETTNRVHVALVQREPGTLRREIRSGLDALAAGHRSEVSWPASLVQLFTPTAAKGYCRLKPDSTGRNDKSKEAWCDPFVEWLRYRGYFAAACPLYHGPKNENIRVLCPIPRDISFRVLQRVADRLRRSPIYGGPPKMDALAVLRLAEILIRYSEFSPTPADVIPGFSMAGLAPSDVISGILITNYQSLGQSRAVSSMATLGVPGWFSIRSQEDAASWLQILDEHQRIIQPLRDDHSDQVDLLVKYRRFLEQRGDTAAWALVEFVESYGPFLMRAREHNPRVRAFQSNNFRRVIVENKPTLSELLDDPGFRAVATAVRKATVNAQMQKVLRTSNYRQIRYDLLPDLRRKRSLPGGTAFIEAVADFISQYNAENARRRELGWSAPRNVTTEELAAFVKWVERLGASTVGALLCAYGSCRDSQSAEEEVSDLDKTDLDIDETDQATDLDLLPKEG